MKRVQRIGAIYPDDMWVDEDVQRFLAECRYFVPDDVDMLSASTNIPTGVHTADAAKRWADNGEIEEAARRLMRYSPSCFAYYCTTVSFIRGFGSDENINQRITRATGLPATTTSTAMVKALKSLGVRRLALASPYMPDVEASFIDFLTAHGFEIVSSVALNLPEDHSIVPPERIRCAAEEADRPEAETVFVGCTGQRIGTILGDIESRLGKPVLSANQVTGWHALQLIGREPVADGRGSLFARQAASAQ